MRKIREVLRLKFEVGLSARQIAVSLQVSRASVGDYLNRFAASGLIWPSALTDTELQRRLFPPSPAVPSDQRPILQTNNANLRRCAPTARPDKRGTGGRMLVEWVAEWRGIRSVAQDL